MAILAVPPPWSSSLPPPSSVVVVVVVIVVRPPFSLLRRRPPSSLRIALPLRIHTPCLLFQRIYSHLGTGNVKGGYIGTGS